MRMLSAEQLLSLINGLGGIVWEAEPETFQFSFVSAEAERILGYPVRRLARRAGLLGAAHPSRRRRAVRGVLPGATRRGEDHEFEYRMIAADGRVVWLRDIVTVRQTPDGGRRLVGIALDITAEKQEEADKHRIVAAVRER